MRPAPVTSPFPYPSPFLSMLNIGAALTFIVLTAPLAAQTAPTVHTLRAGPATVAFTTVFIPVHVAGALFAVGDGHAVQGDGEVNQTALETSLRGRLQFFVRKGLTLEWPRAETPTHHIVMGFDPDLTKATEIAVREAVKFLQERTRLTQGEAYAVVPMACDHGGEGAESIEVTDVHVHVQVHVHVYVCATCQAMSSARKRSART